MATMNDDRYAARRYGSKGTEAVCVTCGKSFLPHHGSFGLYCSRACLYTAKAARKYVCETCGRTFTGSTRPKGRKPRFCSNACYARSLMYDTEDFWKFVDKTASANGCWLWTGHKVGKGYGEFRCQGVRSQAHRFAYEQAFGPIPEGLCVCHKCDTPACVRPDHLFLGTIADNNADRSAKGHYARGRLHPNAKLTEEQVKEMRERHAAGAVQKQLAQEYAVSTGLVGHIVTGRAWRWVR